MPLPSAVVAALPASRGRRDSRQWRPPASAADQAVEAALRWWRCARSPSPAPAPAPRAPRRLRVAEAELAAELLHGAAILGGQERSRMFIGVLLDACSGRARSVLSSVPSSSSRSDRSSPQGLAWGPGTMPAISGSTPGGASGVWARRSLAPRHASGSSASAGLAARAHDRVCCGDVPGTCHAPMRGRTGAETTGQPRAPTPRSAEPRSRSYQPQEAARAGDPDGSGPYGRIAATCRPSRPSSPAGSSCKSGGRVLAVAAAGRQALRRAGLAVVGRGHRPPRPRCCAAFARPARRPAPPLLVSQRRNLRDARAVEGRAVRAPSRQLRRTASWSNTTLTGLSPDQRVLRRASRRAAAPAFASAPSAPGPSASSPRSPRARAAPASCRCRTSRTAACSMPSRRSTPRVHPHGRPALLQPHRRRRGRSRPMMGRFRRSLDRVLSQEHQALLLPPHADRLHVGRPRLRPRRLRRQLAHARRRARLLRHRHAALPAAARRANADGPIAQVFDIGRVRFLMTDAPLGTAARPAHDARPAAVRVAARGAGPRGRATRCRCVVWVNPVPWITPRRRRRGLGPVRRRAAR